MMRVGRHLRRFAIGALAAASALSFALPVANAEVGVTAAVNRDAHGQQPGKTLRVLDLGQSVIFNERIVTDERGLVQILLLDGTTFTVGPNSQLTIDEFVYNPDTGGATVVATVTRGAFRFIGARTSDEAGGATIRTPAGVIGIRGGVVEGRVDGLAALFSMVFGNDVVFTGPGGSIARIYRNGYTLVVNLVTGETNIHKRTRQEALAFQAALGGSAGQNGGAGQTPSDETVAQSEVGNVNSGPPGPDGQVPPPQPVQASTPQDILQLGIIAGQMVNGAVQPCDLYYGCGGP